MYVIITWQMPPSYVENESEVTQLCPTLCYPMDCSLPDSSVHGIFQARILDGLPFPSPKQTLKPSPQYGTSLGWSARYMVAGWLHWTTSITKWAVFCFYWNRYSRYKFAFPACNASAKITICCLTECLPHCPSISIVIGIASDQGTHFTPNKVWQ